jgi:CheY-like chemotaxis protein
MRAAGLRAVVGTLVGAALLAGALVGPGTASADESALKEALADYAAGRYEEALPKLRAYVESNPGDDEVYAVLRDTDEKVLLRVLTQQGEHERLIKYLMSKAHPPEADAKTDAEWIKARVEEAVNAPALDVRRKAGMELRGAGELVVPHLYPFLGSTDPNVVVNAIRAFHYLGHDATLALAEVLQSEDARTRTYTAVVLGDLRDPRAVAALQRAAETDADEGVKGKAAASIQKITGGKPVVGSAADAYVRLGGRYYANDAGLVMGFDANRNLWRWEEGTLARYEVPSYLYPYQVAEEAAHDALDLSPGHAAARALLVRAILAQKVEADVIKGNGGTPPEALAGAADLAASQGFRAASDALGASLAAKDWDVAVECCDLVARTYGREDLNGHPLGDAIVAPEKRVRYHAAIAALVMSPKHGLPNADKVAALAAQAASESAIRQVLVIDDVDETRSKLVMDLAHSGYVSAGVANGFEGVARAKNSPTLDVIVISASLGDQERTIPSRRYLSTYMAIDELLADARTKDMRILVLVRATPESKADAVQASYAAKYGDKVKGFILVPLVTADAMSAVDAAAQAGDLGPDRERANVLAARAAAAFERTDFTCATFGLEVAVEPLSTAAAEGPTPEIRLNAVRALGNIRAGGSATLAKVLQEGDSDELKAAAASSLGAVLSVQDGAPGEVDALVAASQAGGDVGKAALAALGKVKNLSAEARQAVFKAHRLAVPQKAQ